MSSELPKENTKQQIREKSIASYNKTTRSRIKIATILLVVLSVIAYLSRSLILGKPVDAYPATISELLQTVVASGRVMTPQRITIAAETTGRVNTIPVLEGQTVKRGQLLIQLTNPHQ
jgi:HlyD family secretion protein